MTGVDFGADLSEDEYDECASATGTQSSFLRQRALVMHRTEVHRRIQEEKLLER